MLSELQKKKLTRKFRLFDTNHDGVLEAADFDRVVARLSASRHLGEDSPEGRRLRELFSTFWKALLLACDRDGDRIVSLQEWLDYHQLALWQEAEQLAQVAHYDGTFAGVAGFFFDLWDADGDGRITRQEYRDFLSACEIDPQEGDQSFGRLDLDGDGYISREEMLRLVSEFYFSQEEGAPGNWLFGPPGPG
jgi:Ca2+-binding EF-hand superfamily protein